MSYFCRSTGKIATNTGNQALSNIPTPARLCGFDVISGVNTCNVTIYNGSNANAALATKYIAANTQDSAELSFPVFAEYGLWLEMAGGNGGNVIIRYL